MNDTEFKILESSNGVIDSHTEPDWIDWSGYMDVIATLDRKRLIEQNSEHRSVYILTKHGKESLEKEQNLRTDIQKDNKISRQKLHNEAKLTRLKVKSFWPIFILALFGGVYSSIDFVSRVLNRSDQEPELITRQELKEEVTKLRTLILNQKNQDSLLQTNSDKNILSP
jgi:hypothetical protein